jgi:hypothetical protein
MTKSEIGVPLKAGDLKPGTIVVVSPPDQGIFTVSVEAVDKDSVVFVACGVPGLEDWRVANFVRDDGEIVDDLGRVIYVWEYFGKP